MSDATSVYLQYIEQKGYPPKRADHLINFGKETGISLNWKQATTILRNPPTNPLYTNNNNNNNNNNPQSFAHNFTRKRNNNNTNARHSSKSDASWNMNLRVKIDPLTGNEYVSSQGIPPPPSMNNIPPTIITDMPPLPNDNKKFKNSNQKQKRISSKGIPPPPGYTDIWAQRINNNSSNSSKFKVSSYRIPPPPGYKNIYGQPQQKQLDMGRQAFTPSPRSINNNHSSHSRMPTSPQLKSNYTSYDSYKCYNNNNGHVQSNSRHFHSNSITQPMGHMFQLQSPIQPYKQKKKKRPKQQQQQNISDFEINNFIKQIDRNKKQIFVINDIICQLYEAQTNCSKYMSDLSQQCISTYIAPAVLGDEFSNPDDRFAEFLHCMGNELNKFDSICDNYLLKMENKLINPLSMILANGGFNKLFHCYNNWNEYKQLQTDNNNQYIELSLLKLKLMTEMNIIGSKIYCDLICEIDLYWKSYQTYLKKRSHILQFSEMRMRTESIDDSNDDLNNNNEFQQDYDMNTIDEKVGFNNIYNDIVRYNIKLGKTKQYSRVIYIDKQNKIIEILNLKQEIKKYEFTEISEIEKDYNCILMNKLRLCFNKKIEYFLLFESAIKREQFTGELFQHHDGNNNNNNNKLLSIFVGSWNVGDSEFDIAYISEWISLQTKHDLYIIGLQEVKNKFKNKWINGLLEYINDGNVSNDYIILNKIFLMGIGIIFIINGKHINKISHLKSETVATGKGNIIGNKGATAISFSFIESRFLFINCHLAARAERFEKRAANFQRIVASLSSGMKHDILHEFEHIIWFGDLNYRIEQKWHLVLKLLETQNWYECLTFDQLYHQMKFNAVFSGFEEGAITFCPTYRWNRYENIVSNKREQPPSYTDRILYKNIDANNCYSFWQEKYQSSPNCFGSDHRPIYSIFKFKPTIPYFSYDAHSKRKYSKIIISFAEIKVKFTKKITLQLDYKYPMEIQFYYAYCSPNKYILKNGQFMHINQNWNWRSLELDNMKIKPFITDPAFICKTHIIATFIQKNNIFGYSIISLFNIFPKTLLNKKKIIQKYKTQNKHLQTMNNYLNKKKNIKPIDNNKGFNTQILYNGINIGNVNGYIEVDGKLIRKHIKYSTMTSSSPPAKIKQVESESEEEKDNDDDELKWPCQYCTFLNVNNNTKLCQVCGGHKDQFIYQQELIQLKEMGFNHNDDAIKAQLMAQAGNIDRAAHNLLLNIS